MTDTHIQVRQMARDVAAQSVRPPVKTMDPRENATGACTMAHCLAGGMAVTATQDVVQVFGGSGYSRRIEVERLCLDAKITQTYEGTNQIQPIIMARELMKHGAVA